MDAARTDRLTWIGHASVGLDLDGARLLTDPLLRGRLLHLRRHGPPPDPALLRDLDAVLISHQHLDHLDVPSLHLLRRDTLIVVPRGAGPLLRRRRFPRVHELVAGDELRVGDVRVLAVPARHDATRRPRGPVAEPLGYVLRGTDTTIYFAGDTALFDGLAEIGALGLDVALLPVWGWGPSLGPGHMDPEQAAKAAALLRPAVAVPIHWGTFFPRGLAGLRGAALVAPPRTFAAAVALRAPDVAVQVLPPGGALALGRRRAVRA